MELEHNMSYYKLLIMQAEAKARYDTLTKILRDLNHSEDIHDEDVRIGTLIRDARKNLGLTQEAFATKIGLGVGGHVSVSRWESHQVTPSARRLEDISQVLDIPMDRLLTAKLPVLKGLSA